MFTKEIIDDYIRRDLIIKRKHPEYDLYIYNYSIKCSYERLWDDITIQCRGLVLDGNYNIIARPFAKFFNYEELNPSDIPLHLPYEIYNKLDGSLGILYFHNDIPYISTRGSFNSDIAIHATQVLHTKYKHLHSKLNRDITYLFEIIYPGNRIVISYGDMDDIILLAEIDNKTGLDVPLEYDLGFNVVSKYDNTLTINDILKLNIKNEEGVIVKFNNSFRMKIKFKDYVKFHSLVTQLSTRTIWESLRNNTNLYEILADVPDEIFNTVKQYIELYQTQYEEIEDHCAVVIYRIMDIVNTDAELADYLYKNEKKYADIIFKMIKSADYSKQIWNLIEPEYKRI